GDQKQTAGRTNHDWEPFPSSVPDAYSKKPLVGKQCEIAQALKLAGILTHGNRQELLNKLRKGKLLRGQRDGKQFYVHVLKPGKEDRLEKAFSGLETIRNSWPYRTSKHQLPKSYRKYQSDKLTTNSEEILAEVLHKVGILEMGTVKVLRDTIQKTGVLFG